MNSKLMMEDLHNYEREKQALRHRAQQFEDAQSPLRRPISTQFLDRMEHQMTNTARKREELLDYEQAQFDDKFPFTPAISNFSRELCLRNPKRPLFQRYEQELKEKKERLGELKEFKEIKQTLEDKAIEREVRKRREKILGTADEKMLKRRDVHKDNEIWYQNKVQKNNDKIAQKLEAEISDANCTFKPKINKISRDTLKDTTFNQRQSFYQRRRHQKKRELLQSLPKYTFKPSLNRQSIKMASQSRGHKENRFRGNKGIKVEFTTSKINIKSHTALIKEIPYGEVMLPISKSRSRTPSPRKGILKKSSLKRMRVDDEDEDSGAKTQEFSPPALKKSSSVMNTLRRRRSPRKRSGNGSESRRTLSRDGYSRRVYMEGEGDGEGGLGEYDDYAPEDEESELMSPEAGGDDYAFHHPEIKEVFSTIAEEQDDIIWIVSPTKDLDPVKKISEPSARLYSRPKPEDYCRVVALSPARDGCPPLVVKERIPEKKLKKLKRKGRKKKRRGSRKSSYSSTSSFSTLKSRLSSKQKSRLNRKRIGKTYQADVPATVIKRKKPTPLDMLAASAI